MYDATDAVKRGVTLLDEHTPGWDAKINLGTLDVSCYHGCVLGQLFGTYTGGQCTLWFDEADKMGLSVFHGFTAPEVLGDGIEEGNYAELTELWTEIIEARRAV